MNRRGSGATTADVVVVGGGIVGLATARALQKRGVDKVMVLEAEPQVARHQSGRNSGIIHSGLYYAPGSAKARLCAEGRIALYAFCRRHGIPHARTGKLVVAADHREVPELERLAERGRANGLAGLELLDANALRELEPAVAGVAALHVHETGLVDFAEVTRVLARLVSEGGAGEVRTGTPVLDAREAAGVVRIQTPAGLVESAALVNCAGLQADRLARRMGVQPDLRIVPFRGWYFEAGAGRPPLVQRPVYPLPDPRLPFLGVHVHPTLDGRIEAGPNAVLALTRTGSSAPGAALRDVADTLTFPGFWRMAARHWRTGTSEAAMALSRRRFAREVARLVPAIGPSDLGPPRYGIRAQAVDRQGRLVDDFRFEAAERSLHVLNSPSPAATASLAIGGEVADRILGGPGFHDPQRVEAGEGRVP